MVILLGAGYAFCVFSRINAGLFSRAQDPSLGQFQWSFIKGFMILNIINFADMVRREKLVFHGV